MKYRLLSLLICLSGYSHAQNSKDCYGSTAQIPALLPLASKVTMVNALSPPVEMLTNTSRPSKSEQKLILLWMKELEKCMTGNPEYDFSGFPANVSSFMQMNKVKFFNLTSDLHASKLTYGEYAKARSKDSAEFLERLRDMLDGEDAKIAAQAAHAQEQARKEQDRERQERQALQQQQFQREMLAQQEEQARRQAALNFLATQKPFQIQPMQPYQIPTPGTTNCTTYGNNMNCTHR